MKYARGFAFTFCLMLFPSMFAQAYVVDSEVRSSNQKTASFQFIGNAYDQDTGKLLYSELHSIYLNDDGDYERAEVTYRDEKNIEFAKKHLSYGTRATIPSTYFKELSGDFYYEVLGEETFLKLNYKDEEKETSDALPLSKSGLYVVDAGFDRLVSQNWQSLLDEEPLVFSFLAVTRSQFFDFRLVLEKFEADGQLATFRLEPNSTLLRWLLDPISLTYQVATQRLVRFEGLTNVRKRVSGQAIDENYTAVIKYDYL